MSGLLPDVQILDNMDLPQRKQRQYLRQLRRLCGFFGLLPSSFALPSTAVERENSPFAEGGYSKVYRGTFQSRPVVVKVLTITSQTDRDKLHKVNGSSLVALGDHSYCTCSSLSKKSLGGSGSGTIISYSS